MKKTIASLFLLLALFVLGSQRAAAQTYNTIPFTICDETGNNVPYSTGTVTSAGTNGFVAWNYYLPQYVSKNFCSCNLNYTYPSTQYAFIEVCMNRAGSGTNQYIEVVENYTNGTSNTYCFQLGPVTNTNFRHYISATATSLKITRKQGTCIP